ncbi:MAG: glycosyltransferase [Prevotella sp.]|nr:glycosyltransferase [Prevotella sp.]
MQTPLISFIITAYNLPTEMLRQCIGSVRSVGLTSEEHEVILIDDGSDEPAINGIEDLKDKIIYLRQPNQGLSAARNAGLSVATGTYIQFVDGDDYLLPAPYTHCVDLLRNEHPDVLMFCFTSRNSTDAKHAFNVTAPQMGSIFMMHHNLKAAAWSYVFRRQILGDLRFPKGMLHEDEEFTPLLLLRAEHVCLTDATAYFYRRREGSIMQDSNPVQVERRLTDSRKIIFRLHDIAGTLPMTDKVALERRIAQLSMDYLYNIMRLTRSRKQLEEAIIQLSARGLYPLPRKAYTRKYQMFRALLENSAGRRLMLLLLPHT